MILPKLSEVGERDTAGAEDGGGGGGGVTVIDTPLPVSGTVCGDPAALSVMVSVPVRVPEVDGVNRSEERRVGKECRL